MAVGTLEILIGIILLLVIFYLYTINNFKFWKSRRIPGPEPSLLFGTIKDVVFGKHILGTYLKYVYDQYPNEPMVGIFLRNKPVLVINNLELIKTVLIKDFKNFMDRGLIINEKHEPLSAHLFLLDTKRWRPLRAKLTPVFTSGKLKDMFYLLNECTNKLDKYLEKCVGKSVDMREISAKFTTDVIGVCAFGLQANALENEDSIFRKMGMRFLDPSWKNSLKFFLSTFTPFLYNLIGGLLTDNVLNDFFINLTKDTIEYRKKNNIKKHDFIDLLADLKDEKNTMDDIELTDSVLAAQLFSFFFAGFETSSATISNCLFELALNPDIQSKLRQNIKKDLEQNNGQVTYDSVKNMTYLDKVVKETLRKYPPGMLILRETTSPYTIPDTQVSIPTGTSVWVPVYGIQHDPKYYPNPKKFDPERFNEEEVMRRHPMTYLPFGDGPRNCIGLRFGIIQTKVGLIKMLENYTFDVCKETDLNYTLNTKAFLLAPLNGIVLKVDKNNL